MTFAAKILKLLPDLLKCVSVIKLGEITVPYLALLWIDFLAKSVLMKMIKQTQAKIQKIKPKKITLYIFVGSHWYKNGRA